MSYFKKKLILSYWQLLNTDMGINNMFCEILSYYIRIFPLFLDYLHSHTN
jgi:hypothetical protein